MSSTLWRGDATIFDTMYERDLVGPASSRARPAALGREVCDHSERPLNVYWEMTRACQLACAHCRAEAKPERDPRELDRPAAERLLEGVAELKSRLILTGGDPLERPDLFELIEEARRRHIPTGITPSTTPRLTKEAIDRLARSGIFALGLSIDGASASSHDAIRGFEGAFEQALLALQWAEEAGLSVQVNTAISRRNIGEVPELHRVLAERYSRVVRRWSLFALVPEGRGRSLELPAPHQMENLYAWLFSQRDQSPIRITTVEAPMYRRYVIQRKLRQAQSFDAIIERAQHMGLGIRDGNGVIFVSHTGEVSPSGFLPLSVGNVKEHSLAEIYRNSPQLAALRDPDRLTGRCGVCEYRAVCGGSRARAAAVHGSAFAEDPLCAYDPPRVERLPTQSGVGSLDGAT